MLCYFSKAVVSALLGLTLQAVQGLNAGAQQPTRNLDTAETGALGSPFLDVSSIRELPDRRVLLFDRGERQLYLASFDTDEVTAVGSTGPGPRQYGDIGALVALVGDTTLIVDVTYRRWILLSSGTFVRTVPREILATSSVFGFAHRGSLLVGIAARSPEGSPRLSLHQSEIAAGGLSQELASLALVPIRQEVVSRSPDGSPSSYRSMPELLGAPEQAIQYRDGWVAIAHLNPYRVSWRSPAGTWVRGGALLNRPISVSASEKQAFADRVSAETGRRWDPSTTTVWAAEAAPIDAQGALVALSDGRLLVRRSITTATPVPTHDIVDRRGMLVGQFKLLPNERVLGAGAGVLFVGVSDDDGLQVVERRPLSGLNTGLPIEPRR